jgi:hypothetical protein
MVAICGLEASMEKYNKERFHQTEEQNGNIMIAEKSLSNVQF